MRILNFVLTVLYVTVVAVSYYIDSFVILTVTMVIIGTLAGQINVCNVSIFVVIEVISCAKILLSDIARPDHCSNDT